MVRYMYTYTYMYTYMYMYMYVVSSKRKNSYYKIHKRLVHEKCCLWY